VTKSTLFGAGDRISGTELRGEGAGREADLSGTPLDPDFLFNTLHAISSLRHKDGEAADRVVSRLAEMLRMSLALAGRAEVPLREEVDFLERYFDIQQARFPGRLAVGLRVESETLDAHVPCGILQPLVERAIGRGSPPGFRRIEVVGRRIEGELELRVRDRGKAEDPNPVLVEDVGLSSTRARLVHLYGDRHRIEVRNGFTGCVSVTLTIPFRINLAEDSHGNTESGVADPGSHRR